MRITATLVVLVAAISDGRGVSAENMEPKAKEKLAELQKRLPDVLEAAWSKNQYMRASGRSLFTDKRLRLHRVRATGPADAKVSLRFLAVDAKDGHDFIPVDVCLRYYDGRWTTVVSPPDPNWDMELAQRWLAQVIDDATE
jgi:hypothetical protein